MDLWDKPPPPLQREDRDHRRRLRRENPSFSSSLLDAIYRSIDESNGQGDDHLIFYRETTRTKQSAAAARTEDADESLKFRRIEKKKVRNIRDFTNSSSSSSESTCTASRFSSSESEFLSRPKPIKTSTWAAQFQYPEIPNPNHENGFLKSKSKPSKILHDLKKLRKQPISPGARLANFLNSLFNGGTPKTKPKSSNSPLKSPSKSLQESSTCSSTSSFSRSCLSKTPSSRGNIKRSVRFCPVSVIVDEDCRPCGHKSLKKIEPILKKPLKTESARKTEHDFEDDDFEDEDDDDDEVSCSSSDLFELDHLSVIGIERYREELPVYETTHFKTNCAIANGLVL